MTSTFTQVLAFLMSLIYTLIPFVDYSPKNEDELLLNAAMISDVHIDASLPCGQEMLAAGLEDMKRCETPLDTVIVAGDLTNYADEESLIAFYEILKEHSPADKWVVAHGNHDIGHVEGFTNAEAREWNIKHYNEYTGSNNENIYYSMDVKGYTFIVLGDQGDDNWDHYDIYEDQLTFLDTELARATADGKPAFVVCHIPVEGVNGQMEVWEEGSLEEYSQPIVDIMEKYNNVFFISGHVHTGINGALVQNAFGFSCVETRNGVTYINLPTYLLVNRYGIPWNGMGFHLEVYEDEVVLRARRFLVSRWYAFHEFSVPLV